jgi:predicted nucleic acid-binding protein
LILADTSVWVDHLRRGDARLAALLESAEILIHPFVIGEIAMGSLADRATVIELLHGLPSAAVADFGEALVFIDRHRLHGKGIGYVDVHLLASAALTPSTVLWTRDKRLQGAARAIGCAYEESRAH